jgi:membrane-bound inhibitor of C-type lysozyme
MRSILLALAGLSLAGAATAEVTLSIPLELGQNGSLQAQSYTCGDDAPFTVQYVNTEANALAIVPIDGQERIFVNVVAASGARYVSGAYVWWTKGDTARLENTLDETSARECQAQGADASE